MSPTTQEPETPSAPSRRSRRAAWAVAAMLVLSLPCLLDSLRKVDTSSNDVMPWLPVGTPEREAYQVYEEAFGVEEFWILSLADTTEFNDYDRLKRALESADEAFHPPFLRRIRSGNEFLHGLSGKEESEARRLLSGTFFDLRGERPLVIVEATEHGLRNRQTFYDEVILKAATDIGKPDSLKITGSGFLGVMADAETRSTLRKVTPVTFLLSTLLAFGLLRCVKLATIALLASGLSALLSIAIIHRSGEAMSHLLVIVPNLAQLLALSNAVHFIHYYENACKTPSPGIAPWRQAWSHAWLPTVAASVTTAIGFLSLLVSSVPVVAKFAVFGALGVAGSLVMVFLVLPAGLILSEPKPRREDWMRSRLFPALDRILAPRRTLVGLALLVCLLASFPGLGLLKTDARMENFFPDQSIFLKHHRWFESEFGPMETCHLMGRFDLDVPFADQFAFVETLQSKLEGMATPVKIISPYSFASIGGFGMEQVSDPAHRILLLEGLADRFREENLLSESALGNAWRITLFHESVPDFAASALHGELRASLSAATDSHPGTAGFWEITGIQPLFANAQKSLLGELLKSFLMAFLLIAPLVVLFLGNLRLGIVGILPNLFPIVVLFGTMGYFGIRLDIATMVTASVAFGVAVDDTIHFLVWTGRGMRAKGTDLTGAVSSAFCGSGPAILKTTLIISIGMLAFLLSDFAPSQRFAICTSLILVLAVVGDLVMLPALIGGLFSRFFTPNPRRSGKPVEKL